MKIVKRKIDDLIGAEYNPRELTDKQYKDLKDSLKRFGIVDPVIVNKHPERMDIIVGGHQRSKVWKDLGNDTISTVEVELSPDKEKELNVRLNKNTGQFDMDALANYFEQDDLIEWGFDEGELVGFDDVVNLEAEEDDFETPDEIKTDIVEGDLFEIGEHRLLCGDSTDSDQVERLMNGQKADMVFTDPPYGMFLDTDWSSAKSSSSFAKEKNALGGKKHKKVIGDHNDFTPELINTIFASFPDTKEVFIWGADYFAELIPNKNDGSWVVWDKRLDESTDKMYGSTFELCWSKNKHKREIARVKWAGIFGTEKEFDHKRHHPTQKPQKLCEWFFNKWGKESDLVVDLFLGSGTTMISSHQLKRKCYGMELDAQYCQVIIDRMRKLDPDLVIKRNGEIYEQE